MKQKSRMGIKGTSRRGTGCNRLKNVQWRDGTLEALNNLRCVRFKIFTAVTILMMMFWVKAPCGLVDRKKSFGEMCCSHLQPWRWRQHASPKRLLLPTNFHGIWRLLAGRLSVCLFSLFTGRFLYQRFLISVLIWRKIFRGSEYLQSTLEMESIHAWLCVGSQLSPVSASLDYHCKRLIISSVSTKKEFVVRWKFRKWTYWFQTAQFVHS
jgi:hypothetical protein